MYNQSANGYSGGGGGDGPENPQHNEQIEQNEEDEFGRTEEGKSKYFFKEIFNKFLCLFFFLKRIL